MKKFEGELAGWKAEKLSFSGMVVLIKSMLGSFPFYYLFLFNMPVSVKRKLDSIQRRFMWSGTEEKKKDPLGGMEYSLQA